MSALSPRYITELPPVGAADPLVHEDPAQYIQGGITGEHYHLTLAEKNNLARQKIYEPMFIGGDLVKGSYPLDGMEAWGGKYAT